MIVDSSALLALVFEEPGAEAVERAITESERLGIGAPTLVETGIVLAAKIGPGSGAILSRLVDRLELSVVPFTRAHGHEALEAYGRFGRGRHLAALSFGDCLTYAVARLAGEPLLFVGDDFRHTDLEPALRGA